MWSVCDKSTLRLWHNDIENTNKVHGSAEHILKWAYRGFDPLRTGTEKTQKKDTKKVQTIRMDSSKALLYYMILENLKKKSKILENL